MYDFEIVVLAEERKLQNMKALQGIQYSVLVVENNKLVEEEKKKKYV
jgi:hypothetical protein